MGTKISIQEREQMYAELLKNPIGKNDTFAFRCSQCGKCCRDKDDILLNPFDIKRLAEALGITMHEVLMQYGESHIGPNSELPLFTLKMRPISGRCVLLGNDGKCSVQMHKPAPCALYPLGRAINIDTGEINYFIQQVECGGNDEEHTVAEWLARSGAEETEEYFMAWQKATTAISEQLKALLSKLPDNHDKLPDGFHNKLYNTIATIIYLNYDMTKPLIPQTEQNTKTVLEIIGDISKLLEKAGK